MSEKKEDVSDTVEDGQLVDSESLALQKKRIEEMRRVLKAQGFSKV